MALSEGAIPPKVCLAPKSSGLHPHQPESSGGCTERQPTVYGTEHGGFSNVGTRWCGEGGVPPAASCVVGPVAVVGGVPTRRRSSRTTSSSGSHHNGRGAGRGDG